MAPYFAKVECFCFDEQRLLAGEEVDLPIFFFIDKDFMDDPLMQDIDDIVLSYTFLYIPLQNLSLIQLCCELTQTFQLQNFLDPSILSPSLFYIAKHAGTHLDSWSLMHPYRHHPLQPHLLLSESFLVFTSVPGVSGAETVTCGSAICGGREA